MAGIFAIRNYRVLRLVNKGGMGMVYEAIEINHHWRRALKLMSPEAAQDPMQVARFKLEGHVPGLVDHPGVVRIYEASALDDRESEIPFILMEYLDGQSLAQRVDPTTNPPLPVVEALRYGRQIAAALAAVHRQGVVHRDLKPGNVMLVPDPEVPGGVRCKIVDFGLAKVPGALYAPTMTVIDTIIKNSQIEHNAIAGTPLYMSPEQCWPGADIEPRADVYALGSILYELLARRPMFEGTVGQLWVKQINEAPPPLRAQRPELPAALCALVHQMLSKEAVDRPTMEQLVAQLAAFIQEAERAPQGQGAGPFPSQAAPPRPGLWQRLRGRLRGRGE